MKTPKTKLLLLCTTRISNDKVPGITSQVEIEKTIARILSGFATNKDHKLMNTLLNFSSSLLRNHKHNGSLIESL